MLKKIYVYIVAAAVILALGAGGAISLQAAEPTAKNKTPDFKLSDFNGKSHSLADYSDSRLVVIIYVSTRCPVSNAYNKRMADLYREFKDKNITFIGINANKMEGTEEIKEHAHKNGLSFPILKDVNNVVADRYSASVTPEVYVLNVKKDRELLYHGRIDDSRREDQVTSRDLYNALTEILSRKPVSVTKTKAFGCSIKRVKKV